ncbi:uncharacterized protein LOC62_02G002889 [Vanrija pseudolonga]|uniref:Uncharacterized protein n=1 Tax=Vanrija pseudolonga TaxID=143232 RepID=A0AAF1BJ14_9TREE|nr:hypothetical protein LOC62_02G002889 [Vanrija pseudolonga]
MTAWITYYFVEAAWFAARPVRFGDATVAVDLTEDVYRPDAFRPRPRSFIVAAAAAAARARAFTNSPTPTTTPGDMSAELPPYEATSAASASDGHEVDFALSTAGHGGGGGGGGGGRGGGTSWDDGHHAAAQQAQHYNMFASGPGAGRPLADRKVPLPAAQQPVRSTSERSDRSWLVVRNNV